MKLAADIEELGLDHPGAQDPVYRRRRGEIAALAREYEGRGLPPLAYTPEEHATWRLVAERLADVHLKHASARYLENRERLRIETDAIPDLGQLSERLAAFQGFRIRAIPGLIVSRDFLSWLGRRVMSSTQYLRHGSRPEYTPEPDVVHEVIGHVPLFADAEFAALSEEIGRAAEVSTPGQATFLDRLYWYTLEFGLVEERGGVKAYGAGLLSSFGELPHAFGGGVTWRPFVAEEVVQTPYTFSAMQDTLFVVSSFEALRDEIRALFAGRLYRSA